MQKIIALFVLMSASVFATDTEMTALQWLEKMQQAKATHNYQGTVVFFKNGQLDTMKYFHSVAGGAERERLLSLNSPMREVIREAGTVRCVFQNPKKIVVDHRPVNNSFIVDLPHNFANLIDIYQFSLLGEEAVAMLPSKIISIKAKDKYRYDKKIWIDKTHYLPLKIEVYDLSGSMLEQVVFIDMSVGNKIAFTKMENLEENVEVKHIHQVESSSVEEADFVLENIPSGFKPVFFTKMNRDDSGQLVDHLLLSDGFSSISIYREPREEHVQLGLQSLGSVNSYTQGIEDFQMTVLGEVPAKTVQFIAQGISSR